MGLTEALRALDHRQKELEARQHAVDGRRGLSARESRHVRDELLAKAASSHRALADDPMNARAIVSSLLKGRVTFAPLEKRSWELRGTGTLGGLFVHQLLSVGGTSPTGTALYYEPLFRGK
jgi:hypothetical protein